MLAFVTWCQHCAWAQFIRSGKWQYPSIEILHMVGLILIFGSIFVINLRIFGRVLKSAQISDVARGVAAVTLVGLVIQLLSGPLLFITSALKFYASTPFWIKISFLIAALAYHFLYHRPLASSKNVPLGKLRLSAAISMILWLGVVFSGLSIELLA